MKELEIFELLTETEKWSVYDLAQGSRLKKDMEKLIKDPAILEKKYAHLKAYYIE